MEKLNGNRLRIHLIKLEFSPHRKTKRFQPNRIVSKPKVKNLRIKNKLDFTFGLPDEEITKRFQTAVNDSINKSKQLGLPIALYDRELRKAYLQYPDGRREYLTSIPGLKERLLEGVNAKIEDSDPFEW